MQATARGWSTDRGFITDTVDINVPGVGIDRAALIAPRLKSLKPKDAMCDGGIRLGLNRTDDLSAFEHGSSRKTVPNFFRDPVQAKGCLLGSFRLANTNREVEITIR